MAYDHPRMPASLTDLLSSYEFSSYREHVLTQLFVAELLQACWIANLKPVEIDYPAVDFQGYDVVATCGSVVRHIQLKATKGRIAVHRALADKPSACLINLAPSTSGSPPRIRFGYRFFGEDPGQPLDLGGLRSARKTYNTRIDHDQFAKAERPNHLAVPNSKFTTIPDTNELVLRLFGR